MKKILVLDDEPDYVNVLTQLLESAGFKVMAAGTVKEAFVLLDTVMPDLMVVDWNLPDKTGIDFLKEVRELHKFDKARIVMHTVRDSDGDQLTAYLGKADMYFTKPINPEVFLEKIKRLMGQ
jgi:two-component system phosphate regulon response regulator PhoB